MLVRVYRTEPYTASVLRAFLVAEVEAGERPEDPALFAGDCNGDFIDVESPDSEEEEHGSIRHD